MEETRIVISYKGLPDGVHEFDFTIGNNFFTALDYSEFEHGSLKVHVDVEKRDDILAMDLSIEGQVEVACDRCLDMFYMPVKFLGRVYASEAVNGNMDELEEDGDTLELNSVKMELDLTHYIYESIYLSMPMQRIHPDDERGRSTCNAEMLRILSSHQIKED